MVNVARKTKKTIMTIVARMLRKTMIITSIAKIRVMAKISRMAKG